MATTGTYTFNPELAEHIDEAFERCGIDPASIEARHIKSAIRSANLMFGEWPNFGYRQWSLEKVSTSLVSTGTTSFTLPTGGYDIFHATLKRGSYETEMYPISRSDYNALHDKTFEGRPDRYFVDRSTFIGDNPASTVFLWQTNENTTDTIEYWYIKVHDDVGEMSNTLDVNKMFQEAFASGLAYFLSIKYAPQRTPMLRELYVGGNPDARVGGALGRAISADRDTSDAVFQVQYSRYRGRR